MPRRYKVRNMKLVLNFVLIGCIVTSTFLLSIGYASLVSMNLNVKMNITTGAYKELYIDSVQYLNDNGADLGASKIINYTDTMLNSKICLSADSTSSITYTVTIINNSEMSREFTGVTYSDEFYSNSDIGYKLEGLAVGHHLHRGEKVTFNITFYYINPSTNNILESYLNFNFKYYFGEEEDVDVELKGDEEYEFSGVSPSAPIDIANVANINFQIKNGNEASIVALNISVIYTTKTGSTQTCKINLCDENENILATKEVSFLGKQNNGVATITFDNLDIKTGQKLMVKFDQGTINNGQVSISGVKIVPVY